MLGLNLHKRLCCLKLQQSNVKFKRVMVNERRLKDTNMESKEIKKGNE